MAIVKNKKADLNIRYKKYIQLSTILVLSLVIAAFKLSPSAKNKLIISDSNEWIIIEKIQNTTQIVKPQPPQKPPIPEITNSDQIEDLDIENTEINYDDILTEPNLFNSQSCKIIEEEIIPFFAAEVKPELVGGYESLLKNVYYTEIARRIEVEGRVVIEFIVNKMGKVDSAYIVKGIFDELDLIALNAVKRANFTPGLQRGKPVSVKMVIPIVFKLK